MTGNHLVDGHRILSAIGIEVGTTETNIVDLDQHILRSYDRHCLLLDYNTTGSHNFY